MIAVRITARIVSCWLVLSAAAHAQTAPSAAPTPASPPPASQVDALLKRAHEAYDAQRWEDAIRLYAEAGAERSPDPDLRLRVAIAHASTGKFADVERITSSIIRDQPRAAAAMVWRAQARYFLADFTRSALWPAIEDLTRALEIDRSMAARIHELRAWMRLAAGHHTPSMEDAKQFLAIAGWRAPSSTSVVLVGVAAARTAENEAEARRLLDECASRCDRTMWPYPIVRFYRGEVSAGELAQQADTIDKQTAPWDKQTEARTHRALNALRRRAVPEALVDVRWVNASGNRRLLAWGVASSVLAAYEGLPAASRPAPAPATPQRPAQPPATPSAPVPAAPAPASTPPPLVPTPTAMTIGGALGDLRLTIVRLESRAKKGPLGDQDIAPLVDRITWIVERIPESMSVPMKIVTDFLSDTRARLKTNPAARAETLTNLLGMYSKIVGTTIDRFTRVSADHGWHAKTGFDNGMLGGFVSLEVDPPASLVTAIAQDVKAAPAAAPEELVDLLRRIAGYEGKPTSAKDDLAALARVTEEVRRLALAADANTISLAPDLGAYLGTGLASSIVDGCLAMHTIAVRDFDKDDGPLALEARKDCAKSIEALKEAKDIIRRPAFDFFLGALSYGAGRYEEARRAFEDHLSLTKFNRAATHYNLALTLYRLGRKEDAAKAMKTAAQLNSWYAQAQPYPHIVK